MQRFWWQLQAEPYSHWQSFERGWLLLACRWRGAWPFIDARRRASGLTACAAFRKEVSRGPIFGWRLPDGVRRAHAGAMALPASRRLRHATGWKLMMFDCTPQTTAVSRWSLESERRALGCNRRREYSRRRRASAISPISAAFTKAASASSTSGYDFWQKIDEKLKRLCNRIDKRDRHCFDEAGVTQTLTRRRCSSSRGRISTKLHGR